MPTNNLYCIVGPSGSGKTTLMRYLQGYGFREAISHTTRACRDIEESKGYYFVDTAKFLEMVGRGELADYIEYAGNYYGVTQRELDLSDFVIIEPVGARHLKDTYTARPVKVIGLTARHDVLTQRLQARGDSSVNRVKKDLEVFKDLKDLADVFITSITAEATAFSVMEYLRIQGESVPHGAWPALSGVHGRWLS